jgi:hypothetical protein
MSGGIFPDRPFSLNIKCIIFTIIIALGYWYLPYKNVYVLIFLLWLPYIALSWYDYAYDCEDKIQPTLFPYGRYIFLPFKPQGYKQEYDKLTPEQINKMNELDHNITWSIIILIIAYFGFNLTKNNIYRGI